MGALFRDFALKMVVLSWIWTKNAPKLPLLGYIFQPPPAAQVCRAVTPWAVVAFCAFASWHWAGTNHIWRQPALSADPLLS